MNLLEFSLARRVRSGGIELVVFALLAGMIYGVVHVAQEWEGSFHQAAVIDLSLRKLPEYTLFTLARGLVAYLLSLTFAIGYAYWAYYDKTAARFLMPLLDILQSIPVLGFLPGVVLALVYLFPTRNFGLELACVLLFFVGQAWNLAFSFYDSLRSIPDDLRALTEFYRFSPWQRFVRLELPAGMKGLVYNSMISMAGGWFLVTVNEAFVLGKGDFRLPGLGSYMSVALAQSNGRAQCYGIIAMVLMIVLLDQLLWRPLVVWSQKFKLEDTLAGPTETSIVLEWFRRSRLLYRLTRAFGTVTKFPVPKKKILPAITKHSSFFPIIYFAWTFILIGLILFLATKLIFLVSHVTAAQWIQIFSSVGITLARVMAALVLSTLWAIPVGVWIGLNPKWARILQPVIQITASFPAPMIFPLILGMVLFVHGGLGLGSILLMMLGCQWYILFNVVAGASAIPQDLISCADLFRISGWRRWQTLLLPAIFPALVTGWITAAGGAWNASIVAEYVHYKDSVMTTPGIGALITDATDQGNFPVLAASVGIMSLVVVMLNRSLWKKLYAIADARFALKNS